MKASTPPPPSRFASLAMGLIVGNVVLVLALTFLAVKWHGEARETEELRARDAVAGVARALAQAVNGDMSRVDTVLKSAVAAFERAPGRFLSAPSAFSDGSPLALVLPDLRAGLQDADVLLISDADGNVRLGLPSGAPSANQADRDFFIAARDADPAALPVVSKPWQGRVSGKWGVTIARPLRTPEGKFVGVVHASLGSEYFVRRLATVPLGQDGIVALRTADMSLIARITTGGLSNEGIGSAKVSNALKAAVAARPAGGDLVSRSPRDGVQRAVAYQRVPGFPMYVVVGQGTGDWIADADAAPGQRDARRGHGPWLAAAGPLPAVAGTQ